MVTGTQTVVGVFADRDDADDAVEELRDASFPVEEIGYARRGAHDNDRVDAGDSKAGEGAVTGAVAGGVLGGVAGAAAALLIPGIGPVIAGGILATTLGGAAAGAAAGGLVGGLVGMGIPEEDARYYDTEFQAGRTLVTVRAGTRADEARRILRDHGAYDVETRGRGATMARR
jgi:hypothetical protein